MTSFDEYRDKMLAIVATVETLLQSDPPDDTVMLDQCRARMSRILTAYHLYADRELFTPTLGRSDPAQRVRLRDVAANCATLAEEFRAFTRQCAANPVIGRWPEYRLSALAMAARIRRHLHVAEIEIGRCEVASALAASDPAIRLAS
jgi:hypothetical protein